MTETWEIGTIVGTFNRTIVELKLVSFSPDLIEHRTFNRTIVELKLCTSRLI